MKFSGVKLWCALLALSLLVSAAAVAQEEEKKYGWFDAAELSWVSTSGNAESTTLGFNNTLRRVWEKAEFKFDLSGVFAESRTGDRTAVGTLLDFSVMDPPKETTAERYFGAARYARTISKKLGWYVSAEGEQNRPSGIEHRYTGAAGVGHTWFLDHERKRFVTTYGVSYTDEELENTGDNSFTGARLTYDYEQKFNDTVTFNSDLIFDYNFDETDDWRGNWYNAVTVQMSKRLALKASLRLLYRNLPPIELIDLYDMDPDMGGMVIGQVPVAKDELDSIFSTSLVVNF